MSDHLPECMYDSHAASYSSAWCICNRLRACETRVRSAELAEAKALLASRDEAWLAGLDAAREAVAGMRTTAYESASPWQRALAAIDALKEGTP